MGSGRTCSTGGGGSEIVNEIKGNKKAPVLPDPVWAQAIRSRCFVVRSQGCAPRLVLHAANLLEDDRNGILLDWSGALEGGQLHVVVHNGT